MGRRRRPRIAGGLRKPAASRTRHVRLNFEMAAPVQAERLRAVARAWRRLQAGRRDAVASLLERADREEISRALAGSLPAPGAARPARRHDSGEAPSTLRGRGLDYAQSRVYQAGDDMRAMHWSLLARTGRPYVREYEAEHAAPWHVLVDAHAGMLFGTRVRTKAAQAARAAMLAAGLQARLSPRSRLSASLWAADGLRAHDFGCGAAALPRMADWLMCQRIEPPRAPFAPQSRSLHELQAWARRLALHHPAPTRLVLCSDFAWLDAAACSALRPLAAQARLLALHIVDPVELELPELPVSRFLDVACDCTGWLEPGTGPRERFRRAAAQRREELRQHLLELRASLAQLATTQPSAALRGRLLELLR